jgi:hypothetical protein
MVVNSSQKTFFFHETPGFMYFFYISEFGLLIFIFPSIWKNPLGSTCTKLTALVWIKKNEPRMPKMSRSTRQAVRTSGWHLSLLLERHERKLDAMSWPPMQRSKCQWTPSVGRFCRRRKNYGAFFRKFNFNGLQFKLQKNDYFLFGRQVSFDIMPSRF